MVKTAPRRLLVESVAGIHVVRIVAPRIVSEEEVGAVVDQLADLIEGAGATRLVLNFAAVTALSSSLLAELVKLQRSLAALGGALRLCGLPAAVRPPFAWCRVAFAIHGDEREALEGF